MSDSTGSDRFNLERFVDAQECVYPLALQEIKSGRKYSHWMWFIFPQLDGLGTSPIARMYAIRDLDEARAYLSHPVLGPRLLECSRAVLAVEGRSAYQIFGSPDDLKLRSCMTLFDVVEPAGVFSDVLQKYYQGLRDDRTLKLLGR